jgi:hypothetical protein
LPTLGSQQDIAPLLSSQNDALSWPPLVRQSEALQRCCEDTEKNIDALDVDINSFIDKMDLDISTIGENYNSSEHDANGSRFDSQVGDASVAAIDIGTEETGQVDFDFDSFWSEVIHDGDEQVTHFSFLAFSLGLMSRGTAASRLP